jgi:hypothetical protein
MQYPEERYARALHTELTKQFTSDEAVRVTIEGRGVHWTCYVASPRRGCSVGCMGGRDAEYLTEFKEGPDVIARGRTSSPGDTLSAVAGWIAGAALDELYRSYSFIDHWKRSLQALEQFVRARHPTLEAVSRIELRRVVSDIHELWFVREDRAVKVAFYGKRPSPDAFILWDQAEMARMEVRGTDEAADVVHSWLSDRAMPSVLADKFTRLDLTPTAPFYEEGRPVEGEFLVSWDSIEAFYREQGTDAAVAARALPLIQALRAAGFDRTLRAGQSMYTMMVSRSRRHGLKDKQPFVALSFEDEGVFVHAVVDGERDLRLPTSELSDALLTELRRLELKPIG